MGLTPVLRPEEITYRGDSWHRVSHISADCTSCWVECGQGPFGQGSSVEMERASLAEAVVDCPSSGCDFTAVVDLESWIG